MMLETKRRRKSAAPKQEESGAKNPERSKQMSEYLKDKRDRVKNGSFEVQRLDGSTITTGDIEIVDGLPVVFDAEGKPLYKSVPPELFGTSKAAASLKYKFAAAKELMKIDEIQAKIDAHKEKAAEYEQKAIDVLKEEDPDAKKEKKKQRLLKQLAELEAA